MAACWPQRSRAQPAAVDAITEPVLLVGTAPPSAQAGEVHQQLLKLLMQRAGLRYALSYEPVERAIASLRAGLYDAETLRFPGYDRVVPGAIRVDPHLLTTSFLAFSRSATVAPRSWQDLRELRVAYLRGVRLVEQQLAGAASVTATTTPQSCQAIVAAGRVDACVLFADAALLAARDAEPAPLHRHLIERVNLHLWVAPGREVLARRLTLALRAMADSGELARVAGAERQP
ncbi:MAG TPA: hypothetical protein VGE36_00330 [Roseateles sp.]